ncbi:hypothetical protein [Parvularcula sp. LCG005]|uniref:hypothetical protein n=1 Tax=Parvularcula sp. LCG005 TaxID=3078805 RepID=UPI0029433412|nr:hypothetical protein [Parvularcula sp. LCG005]WOI53751.1 hypothetical protein RUI03_01835 [Parvularcula sp. LCG005]
MMRLVLAAAALLSLSACGSVGESLETMRLASEKNIGVCPNVFALEDAARMIDFVGDPSLDNVAWSAEITDVRTACRIQADRPITATVEIDFAVGKGPAASGTVKDLTYFVAVTRRNREVIAKTEFTVPVKIEGGIATVRLSDDVDGIVIPRKDGDTAGTNFEIAVGLSLDRQQVLFNRSGESLKFPNL